MHQEIIAPSSPHRSASFVLDQKFVAVAYLIFTIIIVALLNSILPAFDAPDEFAHSFHAESLSSGQILPRPDASGIIGGDVNTGLLDLWQVLSPTGTGAPKPPAVIERANNIRWTRTSRFTGYPNTGQYGSVLYLPQAIGLAIGRAAGFSVLKSYYLARLLTALTAVGIASIALATAGRGIFVIAVFLTTPMFLYLATSLSQDGLLIAVSALFAALAAKRQSAVSDAGNWVAWGCALLIAMARPPYALLSFLLIRGRQGRSFAAWLTAPDGPLAPIAVLAATIAWLVAVGAQHQPDFAADHRVNSAAQLAGLLKHPGFVLTVIHGTFVDHHEFLFKSHEVIARVNVPLPNWIYRAGGIAILLAAATCLVQAAGRSIVHQAAAIVIFAMSAGAVYAALYLTWTPVGAPFVEGGQGRYLLPYLVGLPLIIPCIGPLRWTGGRSAQAVERIAQVAGFVSWGVMIVVIAKTVLVMHRIYGGGF
ncbi:MAG TPA: DUF2142 domain-containing protein [Stellaceae bacterium]|nr:DUF2142 domain-containing protein [Stellaceae bacterium]